jgi:LmeA-like phospholipid-binding
MRRLAVLGAFVLVLVVLGAAQLVLPGIAAQRLRDRLARSGNVLEVQVHAFPAIELLWHHADRVVVRMGRYRSTPGPLGATVGQSADVGSLDASAQELDTGLLTLRNATLRKRGNVLTGSAEVTEADLRTALPILQSVQPVASGDGRLTLRGTATLFGVSATIDASVVPRDGGLVVAPDVPLGGLATISVFNDPHIDIESVGASNVSAGSFSVSASGRLR